MWNKKVRGQRRRLSTLIRKIEGKVVSFETEEDMICLEVPSSPWIEMPKTYGKVKTAFCRVWISKTEELIRQVPQDIGFCKVVGVIVYPEFWNSQIIIFKDEEYYRNFWDRKGPYQTWTLINDRSFAEQRGIRTGLKEVGYEEVLEDEDFRHRSDIWCYMEENYA